MDKIEKIRQKIEELYDGEAPKHDQQCDFDDGYFTGIGEISKFLDTLSEEPDKSLEEEMKSFIDAHYHTRFDETLENGNDTLTVFDFEDIARHFAEWQKSQMLKDAVEGTITCYNDDTYAVESCCFDNKEHHHHSGDKVRIVVLKAEEE